MKKRIIAMLLCLCLLLSSESMAIIGNCLDWETGSAETEEENPVTIWLDGKQVSSVTLKSDEKLTLGVSMDFVAGKYQWQIQVSSNVWVNILDRTDESCEVSLALVESLLDNAGRTALRCVVDDTRGNTYTSDSVEVTVVEEASAVAIDNEETDTSDQPPYTEVTVEGKNENDYVTVTINYVYGEGCDKKGQTAAPTYTAKIMNNQWTKKEGEEYTYTKTVNSPVVMGYSTKEEGKTYTIKGTEKTNNLIVTVYYYRAQVQYKVNYYRQNIYNDEYTLYSTQMQTGFTETKTEPEKKTYPGFHDMYYEAETVAADGSTVVDCYFDRQYFLIVFDCNGGYGTESVYARYETTFAVPNPSRAGYSFAGWVKKGDSTNTTVPAQIGEWTTSPEYVAQWMASDSTVDYTVAYWGVTGDGSTYLINQKKLTAIAGEKVSGQDDLMMKCALETHEHTENCSKWLEYLKNDNFIKSKGYSIKTTTISDSYNDEIAFNALKESKGSDWDFQEGYLYVVNTGGTACWPKLVVHYDENTTQWYQLDQGTLADYTNAYGTPEVFCYSATNWYIYQYKLPTTETDLSHCGQTAHKHESTCYTDYAYSYLAYDAEKTEKNVTIAGDGSTVVNVYYKHKDYTLRFYYARSYKEGTSDEKIFEVLGGSAEYFSGKQKTIDPTNDAVADAQSSLAKTPNGQWGKVAKPELQYSGAEEKSVQVGDYTYYYFDIEATYGDDISNIWPVDCFSSPAVMEKHDTESGDSQHGGTDEKYCKYENAYFSAWAGQYGLKYGLENTNQTIKGLYQYFDEYLAFDKAFIQYYDKAEVISFIAFWENGANVGWNIPNQFEYKLWKVYLQSDPTPKDGCYDSEGNLITTEKDGKTYYLFKNFMVYDNSSDVSGQTAITLEGYTVNGPNETGCKDLDNGLKYFEVSFYYDLDTSTEVTVKNEGEYIVEKASGVAYGTPWEDVTLKDSSGKTWTFFDENDKLVEPDYPSSLPVGVYEFTGWYTTSECLEESKYDLKKETMPSADLVLYAGWVKKTHTVTFYSSWNALANNKEPFYKAEKVTYGDAVTDSVGEPSGEGVSKNSSFIGWFYVEDGVKCRFTLGSSPVTADMKVYAEWRETSMISYTVRYVNEKDEEVAETYMGKAFNGQTLTLEAAAPTEKYAGYYPTVGSQTVMISQQNASYTFKYVQKDSVTYTVQYVNKITGQTVQASEMVTVDNSDGHISAVTVRYADISGYVPDQAYKSLTLSSDSKNNIITFYYTKTSTQQVLIVHYFFQSLPESEDKGDYVKDESRRTDLYVTIPQADTNTVTIELPDVTGFTYSYFVYEEKPTEKITEKEDGTSIEVKLNKSTGTEIYVYYSRNKYSYTVEHREHYNTDQKVADSITGTAFYGEKVTASAKTDLSGYNVTNGESRSLIIGTGNNVITFYYLQNSCTIKYVPVVEGREVEKAGWLSQNYETVSDTGNIAGCTAMDTTYYVFAGWYTDVACQNKVMEDYVQVETEDGKTNTRTTIKVKKLAQDEENNKVEDKIVDLTKAEVTFYAKFIPYKSNLTLTVNIGSEPADTDWLLLLRLTNNMTGETYDFPVSKSGNVQINLVDVNTYTLTVVSADSRTSKVAIKAEIDGDGAIKVEQQSSNNSATVVINVSADESAGKIWLTGKNVKSVTEPLNSAPADTTTEVG